MNLRGCKVMHKKFGSGIIESADNTYITVRFDSDSSVRKFIYPTCFDKFISFINEDDAKSFYTKSRPSTRIKQRDVFIPVAKKSQMPNEPHVITASSSQILHSFSGTIPDTALVTVQLISSSGEHYKIVIVDDVAFQNTAKGIYWKDRTLSKLIINAIISKDNHVFYKETDFILFPINNYNLSIPDSSFSYKNYKSRYSLYVYRHKNIREFKTNYELVNSFLYFPSKNASFPVVLYYSKLENKYFINETSLLMYIKKYGVPQADLVYASGDYVADSSHSHSFKDTSKLSDLGYNVQRDSNMSEVQRQTLLKSILLSGIMTDLEILNHLEMLVHLNRNKPDMEYAVNCWLSDIEFIQNAVENRPTVDLTAPMSEEPSTLYEVPQNYKRYYIPETEKTFSKDTTPPKKVQRGSSPKIKSKPSFPFSKCFLWFFGIILLLYVIISFS